MGLLKNASDFPANRFPIHVYLKYQQQNQIWKACESQEFAIVALWRIIWSKKPRNLTDHPQHDQLVHWFALINVLATQ